MRTRRPLVLVAVCAAHAALTWGLLTMHPQAPSDGPATLARGGLNGVRVQLLPLALEFPPATPPARPPAADSQAPARSASRPVRPSQPSLPPAPEPGATPLDAALLANAVEPAAPAPEPGSAATPQVGASGEPGLAPPPARAGPPPAARWTGPADPAGPVRPPTDTDDRAMARADHRHCPPAAHPAALRQRGIEGAVLLRVKVDVQGRASDIQMIAGSGWRLLDEAALRQVRGCRFIPASQDGHAIDSWVEFPVRFALAG